MRAHIRPGTAQAGYRSDRVPLGRLGVDTAGRGLPLMGGRAVSQAGRAACRALGRARRRAGSGRARADGACSFSVEIPHPVETSHVYRVSYFRRTKSFHGNRRSGAHSRADTGRSLTSPPKTWPPGPGDAASRAPQGRNSWSSSAPARTGNCIGPGWNTGSEASPAGTRAATGPTSNGGWRSSRRGPARY